MARDYPDNGYPSVTQCLGVLRKIGLEQWFLSNTREFCNAESKRGKEIGSQTHEAISQFIKTGKASIESEYAEEVTTALKSFMLFCKENPEIKPELSEISLTSKLYCYNGTVDCIAGDKILDWKSAAAKDKDKPEIWDEYRYQVSAYVYLYNEINGTDINKAVIVAIAKDKIAYNMYVMEKQEIEDCFNQVFLSTLNIVNYQNNYKQIKKERKKWETK